jgi:hypothetical protein
MTETIGSDFYTIAAQIAPPGLVAVPANYPACTATLQTLTPVPGGGRPEPTSTQLLTKCKELYEAIKQQALEYLVSSYWLKDYDAAHGIHITRTATQQALKRVEIEQYSKPGAYPQMLINDDRTPAQERFIVENALLGQRVTSTLIDEGEQATAAFTKEAERTKNNADCRPGYVVVHCKGYEPPKEPSTTPSQLIQEITSWRTHTSH